MAIAKEKRKSVYTILQVEAKYFIACDDVVKIGAIDTIEDATEVCDALNKFAEEDFTGLRAEPCHV
jgi:hypothetical protein